MPRSTARPSTPNPSAPRISSGNSVTTSKCMTSEILGPIHDHAPRVPVHAAQVLPGHWYPVFARTLDHHHRVARRVDEVVDDSQQRAFDILRFESDQVDAVMFASGGRRQFSAVHEQHLSTQPAGRIALLDALEPRDPPVTLWA